MRSFSLSPPPFEDEEMEDNITIKGSSSYRMTGVLPPGQNKQVPFETQDNRVDDRPQPQHYQQKTPPPSNSLETTNIKSDWFVPKEIILIKMKEDKNRF